MSEDPHDAWIPLTDADRVQVDPCGSKASRLAALARAGLPTPEGWVLDHGTARRALGDSPLRLQLARALLGLHRTARWMLRSSSSLEDRPDQSAAGLFASVGADAVPEDISAALAEVVGSGDGKAVKALLHLQTAAPVAVLAQPQLPLTGWWTVEFDVVEKEGRVEGWTQHGGSPRWKHGDLTAEPSLRPLLDRLAAWANADIWLFELGRTQDGLWVLQARPAPTRRTAWVASTQAPSPDRDDVPRFPLHQGDAGATWVYDGAHSPTPLCPLLAGIFHRWLLERPEWPSRLIHGRWHDRLATPRTGSGGGSLSYPALLKELGQRLPALRAGAAALRDEPRQWPLFVQEWLEFQERYYDGRIEALRRQARRVAKTRADDGTPLPPLSTVAAERGRELDVFAQSLQERGLTRSPAQLEAWYVAAPDDPLRQRLRAFLQVHGHVAPSPWDGRSAPWAEDRLPLWKDLLHRMESPDRVRFRASIDPNIQSTPRATESSPGDSAIREVLTCAEDDDDLLAQAYALWRQAAIAVAESLAVSPRAADQVFDVLPDDLQAQLKTPDPQAWGRAWRRGRALAQQWAAWSPDPAVAEDITRQGIAASPGRGEGPVRRATSALADGGPAFGDVLVVPTILPADAIVFGRIAGLVVEQGEALGHAAILAREYGVPAVVGLSQARRWLATTERVMVDGDSGTATRLDVSR